MIGTRLGAYGVDASGTVTMYTGTGTNSRFQDEEVTLSRVFAHRDTGNTDCPGEAGYAAMGTIRALALAAVPTAVAQPAAVDLPDGIHVTAYSGDVYRVAGGQRTWLDFAAWSALGRPVPTRAPTEYLKYPWAPTIYAVTRWTDDERGWQRANLRYQQWVAAGSPSPQSASWVPGSYLYRWSTNDQLGLIAPDGTYRWLTSREWRDTGYRRPVFRTEGVARLAWAPEMAFLSDPATGQGVPITHPEWYNEDFPTPARYTRFGRSVLPVRWEPDYLVCGADDEPPDQLRRVARCG